MSSFAPREDGSKQGKRLEAPEKKEQKKKLSSLNARCSLVFTSCFETKRRVNALSCAGMCVSCAFVGLCPSCGLSQGQEAKKNE